VNERSLSELTVRRAGWTMMVKGGMDNDKIVKMAMVVDVVWIGERRKVEYLCEG
jgi:hypothetical protein